MLRFQGATRIGLAVTTAILFAASPPPLANGQVEAGSEVSEVEPATSGSAPTADEPDSTPRFEPRSEPEWTRHGGTRGVRASRIAALVPSSGGGLTLAAQPALHWFASGPVKGPLALTLGARGADALTLETELTGEFAPGIHRIDLRKHDARLKLGVVYQWTLWGEPHDGAVAEIQRVAVAELGGDRLAQSTPAERRQRLAMEGIWYDLLDAANDAGCATSEGREALVWRSRLLEEAGLAAAARADAALRAACDTPFDPKSEPTDLLHGGTRGGAQQ